MSLATERQLTLEREKAQVELDWQRKMEDVEREHISKTEELIKRITVAKDEVQLMSLIITINEFRNNN